MTTPAAQSDDARERIRLAALALFNRRGYSDVGMAEVAAKAAVSKGLLFHHFGSKAGLLCSLVDPLLPAYQRLLDQVAQVADPRERLATALRAHLDFVRAHESTFGFVVRHAAELAEHEPVVELAALGRRLEALVTAPDADPAARARMRVAFLGTLYAWLELRSDADAIVEAGLAAVGPTGADEESLRGR
ncbi:TetR/AcrR family transcriptional regulator [Pseudonocardia lutea]|uniref:TetR/AcrR family transcriptional regulator n=1 Tax=Pseudonocardia lutea TaxID=2172015 RepID=A0ABW1I9W9_9PSEU